MYTAVSWYNVLPPADHHKLKNRIGALPRGALVSTLSSLRGNAEIAVGNVLGSNTFNILVILGVASLVFPLSLTRVTVKRELPLCVLASAVLGILGSDRGLGAGSPVLARNDGLILLVFFSLFMYTVLLLHQNIRQRWFFKERVSLDFPLKVWDLERTGFYLLGGFDTVRGYEPDAISAFRFLLVSTERERVQGAAVHRATPGGAVRSGRVSQNIPFRFRPKTVL